MGNQQRTKGYFLYKVNFYLCHSYVSTKRRVVIHRDLVGKVINIEVHGSEIVTDQDHEKTFFFLPTFVSASSSVTRENFCANSNCINLIDQCRTYTLKYSKLWTNH